MAGALPNTRESPSARAVHNDLRCITAASVLQHLNELRGDDADRRASLLGITLYYIGKVKGAQPDIGLGAAIRAFGAIPEKPDKKDEIVTSCIEEFRLVGDQLQNVAIT